MPGIGPEGFNMNAYVDGLVEARNKTWHETKALLESVAADKREMTAEERSSYEKMNAELDRMGSEVTEFRAVQEREAQFEAAIRKLGINAEGGAPAPVAESPSMEAQLRSFLRGDLRSLDVVPSSIPSGRELRTLAMGREFRANTVGTATAGGDVVANTFVRQVLTPLFAQSAVLLGNANVLTTSTGETITIPRLTTRSTAAAATETGSLTASDPAFDQVTFNAFKYYVVNTLSRELIEDAAIDIVSYVAEQAGDALGLKIGNLLISGDGSGDPEGLIHSITAGVTGEATVFAPTADNLIDLFYSVISPYRAKASWVMNDATMASVRKLKADSSGIYLFQPALTADTPDTILGKPVLFDASMPTAAHDALTVVFGDLSKYTVRRVNGIRFESSVDSKFLTDMVDFKTVVRIDGHPVDANAFKAYKAGAAS